MIKKLLGMFGKKKPIKKYRPLPPYLFLARSKIDGTGLFTSEDLPANVNLGLFQVVCNGDIIRTPLAGFTNHSKDMSNTRKLTNKLGRKYLYTTRRIRAGEEITLCYDLYDPEK